MARQDPRREPRIRVAFRLPKSLEAELRAYADKHNLVITSVVEDCLIEGLAARKSKKAPAQASAFA